MAERPTLPYFAPAELLPAPLPTVAEILASTTRLSAPYESAVVRVGDHFAVKYGGSTRLQEGENMLFVQQCSSVLAPKVYALFHDDESDMDFIVMEYIPGENLERAWGKLGTAEKRAIVSQLRRHMDELRSIPSPGYYGGIWRQPIRDFYFEDPKLVGQPHHDSTISEPHETEEQWVEAMWRCVESRAVSGQRRWLSLLRRHYHAIFKGHRPVFTHANLFLGNIMLREDGTAVIIDWEFSGWYPSFWEYCCTVLILGYYDDWSEWIHEVLDEYVAELGWMRRHRILILDHYS
ncbi:kinase-like domain-containing protein [Achaetomium macrosporum]|uniref:Kinase-like domain-containing protein n=1 Tax=Achaetomium macrosporum TaxID=79813 RepID=A0AAN7H6V0_9PEZI|nr:kinase-like domain-containing protein [Achaetomium macrosporum]